MSDRRHWCALSDPACLGEVWQEDVEKLEAENERLTAENAQLRKMFEELVEESKLDVAEGAQLRALNAELAALLQKSLTQVRGELAAKISAVITKVEEK